MTGSEPVNAYLFCDYNRTLQVLKDSDLCGYTSDCATHEKERNYHESTKGIGHIGRVEFQSRFTGNLVQGFLESIYKVSLCFRD